MSGRSFPNTVLGWLSRVVVASLAASLALPWLPAAPSQAATTIGVNGFSDSVSNDGVCTLREAIIAANKDRASGSKSGECRAGSGTDTILVPAGTYTLTRNDTGNEDNSATGDLDIKTSLVISPTGLVTITAASGFSDRIFQILSGNVTISGVTLSGGNASYGGAIHNGGTLTLSNSTLTGNRASIWGGGIKNAGSLTLTNVTISGNASKQDGGGLYNLSGTAVLNNVTIANNEADSDANGSGNGGGIFRSAGTVNISNTVVGGNRDKSTGSKPKHLDCSGALNSLGYNLIQSTAGCSLAGTLTGNLTGVDPLLNTLRFNGGTTATHSLRSGSPAIDAGNPAAPGSGGSACAATDQRSVARPQGPRCDIGAHENTFVSPPILISVIQGSTSTTVSGRVTGLPNTVYTLEFFASASCDLASPKESLGTSAATTDDKGDQYFQATLPKPIPDGKPVVTAVATAPDGSLSASSSCALAGFGNDSWPRALELNLSGDPAMAVADQYIDTLGQSRWFKFRIQPNSKLIVTLTNLPANYDLTVYKDIAAAYAAQVIGSDQDLVRLGAEFAPSAFAPSAFAPSAFAPSAFAPSAFAPDAFAPSAFAPSAFAPSAFAPSAFAPSAFAPSAFAPSAFAPSAFAPDAFAPDAFAPSAFAPSAFAPSAFAPSAFAPSAFAPSAFASAQTRSLIGVSAFEGTSGEGLLMNTWNNAEDFYVRVRGREGAFSLAAPFHLEVTLLTDTCRGVAPITTTPSLAAVDDDYKSLILTDMARLGGDTTALSNALAALAARPEVKGRIVDVAADAAVAAARAQADSYPQCAFAVNELAYAVKGIVDRYRAANVDNTGRPTMQYIVIVGSDDVIPFFRHPDQALLGSETNYVPPVKDNTTSQASLRLNYVLSQDRYGAGQAVSLRDDSLPIADLAVGRLVETPDDMLAVLNAYLGTANGMVATPSSALVTGYDFLQDAADQVASELADGLGVPVDTLIADRNQSPEATNPWSPANPRGIWTADNLRTKLLAARHDLIFLGGHFSAASALAADFKTGLLSTEVAGSAADFTNAIIFSAGCHSGYNIVNAHGVPQVTFEPDWAQVFARKGATLIAGTGYQYGDTDFVEYSERLYLNFAQELRRATGPISVGQALVAAKQRYLADTPQLRGIHEKSYLEATLFGLPMLSVDLPVDPPPASGDASIVSGTTAFTTNPGSMLGLAYADVNVVPTFSEAVVQMKNPDDNTTVEALYLSGSNGVVTNPAEPALPLEARNVSVAGTVLRGVGFRGGTYTDQAGVLPFTGAPATEIRGVHTPFFTSVFYPIQPWAVNYFDALVGGATRLTVTPAQFLTDAASERGTLRRLTGLSFRLFYNDNVANLLAAEAAAPTLVRVSSTVTGSQVNFQVRVDGNPAAGIQEVWVTYTSSDPTDSWYGSWQPLNLNQKATDTTAWEQTLTLPSGTQPGDVRFMAQAVNGVGLVSLATNLGAYYVPGQDQTSGAPTSLTLGIPVASGAYGTQATFSAVLRSNGQPLSGQRVIISLGAEGRAATTDANGSATITLPLLGLPGQYAVNASFAGSTAYGASIASGSFTIVKQATQITLDPTTVVVNVDQPLTYVATLADSLGRPIGEKTVFFAFSNGAGTRYFPVITDYAGRARLSVSLPAGTYAVTASFGGFFDFGVDGQITLGDDRYEASTVTGALRVNTPPVAQDDSYATDEDTPLTVAAPGVLANDSDADGDALTVTLVGGPAHGGLTLNGDGSFAYAPAANYNGADRFTYTAGDGIAASNVATVMLTVNAVNDIPVAQDDSYATDEDTPLTVAAPGVLANDSDADGDALTVTLVGGPAHGGLTLNGDGSFAYAPAANYNGVDSFTYTAGDGAAASNVATVTLTVNAVNDIPEARDDSYATDKDTPLTVAAPGVLANDSDADGDALSVSAYTQPASGAVTVNADGGFTYTPAAHFHGATSFTYTVSDGQATATATVTVTVTHDNRPPDCHSAGMNPPTIWSPNKRFYPVTVVGVTDPDGNPVTITITAIRQDEPTGNSIDGHILGPNAAEVRAERDGRGDGRVYHVWFEASDDHGGNCTGDVRTAIVPHDQAGTIDRIDQGPQYDSTKLSR